jgi:hypothetical protein
MLVCSYQGAQTLDRVPYIFKTVFVRFLCSQRAWTLSMPLLPSGNICECSLFGTIRDFTAGQESGKEGGGHHGRAHGVAG